MARPVALLDANVLYPARLWDLLIRLDVAGLYQARWSERILDECFRNLIRDRPDLVRWSRRSTWPLTRLEVARCSSCGTVT